MNNRGQTIFFSIIIGVLIYLFGMLFLGFLDDEVTTFQTDFNCGSTDSPNLTISDGSQMTCLMSEIVTPYFIMIVVSMAGGYIISRFIT